MKNLVYLLMCCLVLIACDNQITDPSLGDPPELEKKVLIDEIIAKDKISSRKSYKMVSMLSEYNFNPESPNCGGFLRDCNTKYSYESARERTIRNLKIYSPSKLVVDGKVYKTYNIYTINRFELLSKKGTVEKGRTWGTFKIYSVKDDAMDEDGVIKYDQVTAKPLDDLGKLLFRGEFSGKLKKNSIEMNLSGKGFNSFSGKSLVAKEKSLCGNEMMCWSSKLSGKIKKVEYIDD